MLKLLTFFFAILSVISLIQCTPTPTRDEVARAPNEARHYPSPKPPHQARHHPSPKPRNEARHHPSPKPRNEARHYPSPKPRNEARHYPSPKPQHEARHHPSPKPRHEARHNPSPKPEHQPPQARGLCDFLCPPENIVGTELSRMYTDSGRLYCRYSVDDNGFCMYNRNSGALLSGSSLFECDFQAMFHCPGTKNGQEDMGWYPSPPKDSRSVNLPQFVKARAEARRAAEEDTA